ncbi:MAG: DMT family transporter, partial [Pseudomonadota bacterium]
TRFLSGGESVWTTFIYTGVIGALASCFYVPFVWQTPTVTDLPLFFAVGLFGAIAQGTLIIALSFAPASTLAPLLYFSLIWGASFGFIIFDEVPDFLTISGAAIIVGAGLYVRHRERVRTTEK